jgi:hypothetical protein
MSRVSKVKEKKNTDCFKKSTSRRWTDQELEAWKKEFSRLAKKAGKILEKEEADARKDQR